MIRERKMGGPLTRKIHRDVDLRSPDAICRQAEADGTPIGPDDVIRTDFSGISELLHGKRPRVFDANGNSVTEAPLTPRERIGELIADAEAYLAYRDRLKLGADLHSPAWFAQEIAWRLQRAIRDADEPAALAVWLAYEAGRLSKEAQIVIDGLDARTPTTVAREEASERGLRAANKERTAENAERDTYIIGRATEQRAKFPSYRNYRVATDLAEEFKAAADLPAEFKLSSKQIGRIIAHLFD